MNSPASQAMLREAQREVRRNAKLDWKAITENKDFFFVSDLMHYRCDDTIKLERAFPKKMVSFFELYFEDEEEDELIRKLKIAENILGASDPKYQKLIKGSTCAECGISTAGRKIRSLWNNVLCEECGEHSDDEEEEETELHLV